ncbi:TBPIP domain-containing protein [Vairimorpha necatrix]|uniref:TBPIP domain-containing protein n=1 Tax=Vairimorpha necatrix TaxID=6039 RepID=A0AAX4JCW7_9MICR
MHKEEDEFSQDFDSISSIVRVQGDGIEALDEEYMKEDAIIEKELDMKEDEVSIELSDSGSLEEIIPIKRGAIKRRPVRILRKTAKPKIDEDTKKKETRQRQVRLRNSKENLQDIRQDSTKEDSRQDSTKENTQEDSTKENTQEDSTKENTQENSIKEDSKDDNNINSFNNINNNLTDDEKKIFDFFFNINRPVSSAELLLNFKKQISNTLLQNICTNLESKNLIIIKLYSKTKIFMINPSVFDMSEQDTNKQRLKDLSTENETLKKEYTSLINELKSYKNMETEEELDEKISKMKSRLEILQERVKCRERGELISKKEIEEYIQKNKKMMKIKKERSKMKNEMIETICENMNIKKRDLIEELDL